MFGFKEDQPRGSWGKKKGDSSYFLLFKKYFGDKQSEENEKCGTYNTHLSTGLI
jgi:hypothetical protein